MEKHIKNPHEMTSIVFAKAKEQKKRKKKLDFTFDFWKNPIYLLPKAGIIGTAIKKVSFFLFF